MGNATSIATVAQLVRDDPDMIRLDPGIQGDLG